MKLDGPVKTCPGSDVLALFFERVLQAFLKFLKIKKISYSIFYGWKIVSLET